MRTMTTLALIASTLTSLALAAPAMAASSHTKPKPKECVDLAAEGRRMLRSDYGLKSTVIRIDADALCDQINGLPSKVAFLDALRRSMDSFLSDADHVESPLALAVDLAFADLDVPVTTPVPAAVLARARAILVDHLNRKSATIRLLPIGDEPEGGESVEDNWIVEAKARDLSDHVYWAIVARDGGTPVYNYGFN